MNFYSEIDVSDWASTHEEPLGSKPKRWLRAPDGSSWLMKERTYNRRADGSLYAKGDDWSERVASSIAFGLSLPAATVEFAIETRGSERIFGTICRNLLYEGETLVHGNELLRDLAMARLENKVPYDLESVRQTLEDMEVSAGGCQSLTAWDVFVGYLVLDALIGNTDRHAENWGVIDSNGSRRLAPSFDHASSLGFLLDDSQRVERLATSDQNRTPEAYARRGRSRFERKPLVLDVAAKGLATVSGSARERWLGPLAEAGWLLNAVDRVPPGRISDGARAFAARVLLCNRDRLLSHPVCNL